MNTFAESDLILNKDGSVYHLSLKPEDVAENIIVVGDPERVYRVSKHFDDIDFEMNKREFITHTGTFKNKRITVMSTGMGVDNIEIAMIELDALFNSTSGFNSPMLASHLFYFVYMPRGLAPRLLTIDLKKRISREEKKVST